MAPFADVFELQWKALACVSKVLGTIVIGVRNIVCGDHLGRVSLAYTRFHVRRSLEERHKEFSVFRKDVADLLQAPSDAIESKVGEERMRDCKVECLIEPIKGKIIST